jgi:N-acetylmuramoyl-L-alanine amidase
MFRQKLLFSIFFILIVSCSFALSIKPLNGVKILLDPGHGGSDPGAVGPTGLKESATNLRVARYLRDLLIADGAEVHMTREMDKYLSLSSRIELAKQIMPDLFVSIHHNASLKPRKTNRSEIYFNSLDSGISRIAGKKMISQLENAGFGEETLIVPGGFFVLRNNPSPAVLTEGSYISIPEIEKQLKTGKSLTNQAQALRTAIKQTFVNGPFRVKVIFSETPVKINTSFFNFIFTANKPLKKIRARLSGAALQDFGFDPLPPMSNTYRFYNTKPLVSGDYELQLTFESNDGSITPRTEIPLKVELPFARAKIKPVAPYIPANFKGNFPVQIKLFDHQGKLNRKKAKLALFYGDKGQATGLTSSSGKTLFLLNLTGNETHPLEIRLVYNSEIIAKTLIPIKEPDNRYVLGKITNPDGKGVEKVLVKYGIKCTKSCAGGFFFLEYPKIYHNLQLNIVPPKGYQKTTTWIRTKGEPVAVANIKISFTASSLFNKKIALMAPEGFEQLIAVLGSKLENAGTKVVLLSMPENMKRPEYQAILEANLHKNIDLLLSFKSESSSTPAARYYYRGGKGKAIADKLAALLADSEYPIRLKVEPGSDYEISHTGATSVVLALPRLCAPDWPARIIDKLVETLKISF